ncbi:MAG TPA: N,N-dimethylformamidase beta subunit family domain-containing protein, partial [Vicinamibacterales bacterium]|nr:N,N-dimethylformamidase beta subunit family domain-containing protein [Vicinamibacterales bacterium]
NTDATTYRVDIFRLGYYNGVGARKITSSTITLQSPQVQPLCVTDSTTGLVDCGTWATSASWSTAGQVSGIYLAKLTRIDNGVPAAGASHIIFVVRDDTRHANLLFQTSDTTWQAYNSYGGASLYSGGPVSNPPVYGGGGRATKVSYNRPFNTRQLAPQSWVFNAEYPMLRWLERNGYDVSYFSGVDADRSGAQILDHKVFMSVGHDEYWSGTQRTNVEAARDAGVHLAFFSGNEMLWKTRWETSIDGTATPHRTLVSYKETLAGAKIDPDAAWTGLWRDASFSPPSDGGRPENGLTGTFWTVNCCTFAITVPSEMGAYRFWRNTDIGSLPPGTSATLAAGSLGYEWDEDLNNGFRPAGLARLSSTTVDVTEKFSATGYGIAPGTATHSLTLYRKDTLDQQSNLHKALVFGAGTVQWSWGLDSVHDREASTPDSRMQQATINLFADMGVQPGTIQSGLIAGTGSTDTVAPTSVIVSPTGGNADSGGHLTISGTASDAGGGGVAGVEVSVDGGVTWRGASGRSSWTYDWSPGAPGTATIMSRATDDSGNIGGPSSSVLVTVLASPCPCNHLWNPATAVPTMPDALDPSAIEVGVKFFSDIDGFITAVRFYKSAANTGTHIGHLWTAGGTLLASGTFTNETAVGWQELRFNNPVPILANTTYVASYHTNVGHYSGDSAYFASSGVNSPPLHAPASGASTNGVFTYGTSAFPTTAFHAGNYWVDVTFAQSVADDTPPSITQVRVTAIDGQTAVVTWNTNEEADSRVDYSTDQSFPTGQTFSVANSNFVLNHTLTLTGLIPNNTYYMRITSIDHGGNPSVFLTPSFTVPGPTLHDTAPVDFLAGTHSGTYVTQTGDGELTLAPAVGAEFFGSSLPPGWISVLWQPESGGTVSVANGVLTVDGARVGTCTGTPPDCEVGTHGPGYSLEFVATFTGDPFQHAGFGVKFEAPPWAMFSTGGGSSLMARSHNGGSSQDTPLGTQYLGAPHRYRIDWTPAGMNFFIDGVSVASHAVPIGTLMRPISASDFNPLGGNIVVDWIRMLPYATSGSFMSRVFDAGSAVDWASIYWTTSTPAGTSVAIYEHTGDTPAPDATWTDFALVSAPGQYPRQAHARYVQYRADLTTSDPSITPELRDIIISTDHAPVAVNDGPALTNLNTSKTFSGNPLNAGSLMFNDTDSDTPKAQFRVTAVSTPAHGTATINPLSGAVVYTPQTGYSGPDSFTYTITDGLLISNAGTVSMIVGNVPPVAADDGSSGSPAYFVNEDVTLNVPAVDRITANDNDPNGDAITSILVSDATHGHVVLGADGAFTYTPNANTYGPDQFSYQDSDPFGALSNVATVYLSVTPVNDAPSFTKGADQVVLEDAAAQSVTGWATAMSAGPNEASQALDFIVSNNNNPLFSVQPAVASNGTLTFTPAVNANGTATVSVQIHDDGGTANGVNTSAAQTFTITVTGVNDAPSFTKGADQTVLEDSGAHSVAGWATAISAGPNESQAVDFIVGNDNNALFAAQPAVASNGTLTFTPAGNANGSATVSVQAHDDGGTANGGVNTSAAQTFIITVTAVNDAPTFTNGANQSAAKNSGAHSVPGWATNLSTGPANESGQALTSFTVTNDNAALFSAAPAVAVNGTLTYTSAAGAIGVANVTVRLSDNGGTANGGVDISAPHSFTITVFDPPPVAQCQNVTVTATLIGTAAASIDNGSFDPDGGAVTLAQVPPGPYTPGQTSVTLNVTDSASQMVSCSATVTVNPFAPGASFGFEEASGTTVVDSSGNGNNGTFNAANGPTRVTTGRFGKAMQFDGVDDLITVADSNSLDLTSAATMMAWVKVTTQTGWRNILLKQNGGDLAYALYANNNGSALGQPNGYVNVGGVAQSVAALDGALSGRWMHVAMTYGGGSLKIYLNGVLHRSLAVSGNMPVTSGPLWLGGNQVWLDEFFSGVMDEVRLLGVTLSESDIRTLMHTPVVPGTAAPATSSTGLVASYNFDDGTATDKTGLGHNGTLGGAVSAQGIYGNAVSFNGTSNYVTIADANDLDFTTGMTLEAWVRPTTLSSWRSLLLKQGPQGLVYAMYGSDPASKSVGLVRIAGVDRDVVATSPLPLNAWSHVVVTYEKAEGMLRIWVDGIPVDDRSVTGDITTSTGALYMGGNQFWGEYFNGRIDNVRLYNRALGIVEIQTNQATPVQ